MYIHPSLFPSLREAEERRYALLLERRRVALERSETLRETLRPASRRVTTALQRGRRVLAARWRTHPRPLPPAVPCAGEACC